METYFAKFRKNIIGIDQTIDTPYNPELPIVYADWTASGRSYSIIEDKIKDELLPFVANTHTETSTTGMTMTYAYHEARTIIRDHVNASKEDILVSCGSGMTGAVNKFQRILGIKIHESLEKQVEIPEEDRPVIFITHMEHHSNQTSWLETISDVVVVPPAEDGLVSLDNFRKAIAEYSDRNNIMAAVTACSNVTGIVTPYHEIAKIVHEAGGVCLVDFACSAPYVEIDMHPKEEGAHLDAIVFSPHKFLGGPGSAGVLIFNKNFYHNTVPDNPGGGTVDWTNPWGEHKYVDDIESREDGGTPAFLQTIKTALAIKLKETMTVQKIMAREEEILDQIWAGLENIPNVHILAGEHKHRLGVISFYIDGLLHAHGVQMLNDRFGIQTRGGCSCAGTYGHYLLNVTKEKSAEIVQKIAKGKCKQKPGWIRMSIHPTMTDEEIQYILKGIKELAENFETWILDYEIDPETNGMTHKSNDRNVESKKKIKSVFEVDFY